MQTFLKLKELRSFLSGIPGIGSCKDFDIAIEIGHHQQLGAPLTLKQLMLLDIAPPATMRRHLNNMVREGVVVKHTAAHDLRIIHYTLSDDALNAFAHCLEQLRHTLTAETASTVISSLPNA